MITGDYAGADVWAVENGLKFINKLCDPATNDC